MSELIESIERRQLRRELPRFRVGDRVRVHFQVVEGNRRRTQVFEGVVIRQQGAGSRRTFTVRKLSFGVGVERTFPLHTPKIERLEIVGRGEVRRAKLYYLRGRVGRRARLRERRDFRPEELAQMTEEEAAAAQDEAALAEEASADGAAAETADEAADEAAAEERAEEPAAEGDEAPSVGEEDQAEAEEVAEEAQPEGAASDEPAAEVKEEG